MEGEGVRRLALVEEELQQTLAWDQASGLQGGAEEARASLVEHSEVRKMGWAVQGEMVDLGSLETGYCDVVEVCWVWVGEHLLECLV